MKFPTSPILPRVALPALALLLLTLAPPAAAAEGDEDEAKKSGQIAALTDDAAGGETPGTSTSSSTSTTTSTTATTTATADTPAEEEEESSPFSASLTWGTDIGGGTFVSGGGNNPFVSSAITPAIGYKLTDDISTRASIGFTWYHQGDTTTPYFDNRVYASDLYLQVAHGNVWSTEEDLLNISAAFRLYFPTSLASQFQNRIISMRPTVTSGLTLGPVSISYTLGLMKYFSSANTASIDCGEFPEGQCREGRGPDPNAGFSSEVRGGEVFLGNTTGVNSFYVMNALSVSVSPVEGLSVSLGATFYNLFGVQSFDKDQDSGDFAQEGRAQTDRLITSVSVSYQIIKELKAAISWTNDDVRPLGLTEDSGIQAPFVNPDRLSENGQSLGISVTASL